MRRTKIVATIGPASRDPEVLVRMVEAGMDVARLNFSHGSADEHAETASLVRQAAGRAGRQVAVLQDLPGPKLRIGPLTDGIAELKPGDDVTFVCGDNGADGNARRMYITWAGLADTVDKGEIMYLADGAVRLRVSATRPADGEIDAEVEVGGTVASRQGLNIPGETAALPSVAFSPHTNVTSSPGLSSAIPSLSAPMRSLGPGRSCRTATWRPARPAASRTASAVPACSSAVPWEKFRRATSIPASTMRTSTSGSREAGPMVATILVRRIPTPHATAMRGRCTSAM